MGFPGNCRCSGASPSRYRPDLGPSASHFLHSTAGHPSVGNENLVFGLTPDTESQLLKSYWLENFCHDWHNTLPPVRHRLEDALKMTCGRHATDIRDHVFALLGLVDESEGGFSADYTMTPEVVYQKAMLRVFESSNKVELLVHTTATRRQKDIPSWCIDFSYGDWMWNKQAYYKSTSPKNTGSGHGLICHDIGKGSITVRGKIVAQAAYVQHFTGGGGKISDFCLVKESFRAHADKFYGETLHMKWLRLQALVAAWTWLEPRSSFVQG